jgi:hypothetical protein
MPLMMIISRSSRMLMVLISTNVSAFMKKDLNPIKKAGHRPGAEKA